MREDITNTGAFFLARSLKLYGVSQVFGLCGDHINSLYRALDLENIEIIGTRTESAAVQMADSYARATGRLGVALVTGCPGHTNALTGISIAQNAQSPVLVISGLTPVDQRYRGGSQVLEQESLAKPITKWSLEVPSASHISEIIAKAIQIATLGTPGAVSLSIPSDILDEKVPLTKDNPNDHIREVVSRMPQKAVSVLAQVTLNAIQDILRTSQRPVLILGSGARHDANGHDVNKIVRELGIPTFTIDQARGLVADDGEICFGYADPIFCRTFRVLKSADTVILAGSAIDFHQCYGRNQLFDDKLRVIQITEDFVALNQCRQSDITVSAAPVQSLHQISVAMKSCNPKWSAWLSSVQATHRESLALWTQILKDESGDKSVHPLQLCESLARHRKHDTGIIIDAGDFVHWARCYFPAMSPGRWMDAVLIGNLGGSIPLGIGSLIANPSGQIWSFIGDGGFGFYAWDLEVAVQRKLPLKVVLGNDAGWGVEKRLQTNAYGKHIGCELPEIRYDKFAELIGAKGFFVEDIKDLDKVVDDFIASDGPALLNVKIRQGAGRPLIDFPRY